MKDDDRSDDYKAGWRDALLAVRGHYLELYLGVFAQAEQKREGYPPEYMAAAERFGGVVAFVDIILRQPPSLDNWPFDADRIHYWVNQSAEYLATLVQCPECGGSGMNGTSRECRYCNGEGKVQP